MKTVQAHIWHDNKRSTYLLYSPEDGVDEVLELYHGTWGAGKWQLSSNYKKIEDLELDVVHYKLVDCEGLRKTLLTSAIHFVKTG